MNQRPKILVTGANGFVGRALCEALLQKGFAIRKAIRRGKTDPDTFMVGEIGPDTDWDDALCGIDAVVHLAARVHVMHESNVDPAAEFSRINVEGTRRLALAAARLGVKRLVYVSSIKVNGESTEGRAFSEQDRPDPQDAYAVSKWQAEQLLWEISEQTGLEVVVVRPPLVYGPHVGGNFLQMLKIVGRELPLPLASSNNLRSLIHVGNLADALCACVSHPDAAGETFLVSDGADISTAQLLTKLAALMGVESKLFRCPRMVLTVLARIANKSRELDRLLGSLQVDSGKIRTRLNWKPPYSQDQGLQQTASWYRSECR